ncbi:pilus assembly protein CpaB [Sphingorhabdus rigui]|uniref:Pilus assembly protein CpaB n=1 Tax=Sphingorhabdus rigui TaxID=1282858 RepID=A0A840B3L1_9SPHN|nr:Flp pilus assembly protein CpaB [Sphingorhabdus rigui]MBB3943144.1 pilus assembly protein CpaB [Sphingorhabdus rigui]
MDRKKVILLVAALLIAAVTALMARSMFTGASAPPAAAAVAPAPVPTGPKVLVATKALPVGTIITADSVRYQPWPKELIEAAYFQEGDGGASIDSLVGTVVRNAVTAGQPLTQGSIVKPGDRGFLAAALGPGMRAVTVPVSALTGVAGFVFPGDRVDLVLTQNVEASAGPPLKVSETIVRNLRVLATDQRSTPSVDDKGNSVVSEYKLVTIEATPRIAEKITVAQSIGTISLSLRSLADNAAELEQALASGDINIPEGATADQERAIMRQLTQRPSASKSSYATGGDVSRFQRSSMPEQMPLAVAAEQARTQKQVEKIMKGPVVRVSRGGNVTEIDISRR